MGAGVGGLAGAGVGALSADKGDPNLLRKTMVGGLVGAGTGAAIGGLSSGGISPEMVTTIQDEGIQAGHMMGFAEGLRAAATNPEIASDLVAKMSPEVRDLLSKRLKNSNWFTRMFGG